MIKRISRSKLGHKFRQIRRVLRRDDDPQLGANELLSQFSPKAELSERMESLRQLLSWFFADGPDRVEVRLRYFMKAIEASAARKQQFAEALDLTLHQCTFFRFFSSVGLTVEHGLWGDIAGRLLAKLLSEGSRHDFINVAFEAFDSEESSPTPEAITPATIRNVGNLLRDCLSLETLEHLQSQSLDAGFFLATHIAHYGLSSAIQRRVDRPHVVSVSPFFAITAAIRNADVKIPLAVIDDCKKELASVYTNLEHSGVSVDVVNRLETMEELLLRLSLLLKTRSAAGQPHHFVAIYNFLCEVAASGLRARSVSGHLTRHFYLMARKVVERNGHSGEHYIARNSRELAWLFRTAIGGGFIVVVMTVFKTLFIHTGPAPLFMALGIWIIYTIGFLSMQFTGATLATKIPSFTASKLASFLNNSSTVDFPGFRREVRQVWNSQLVALAGNICGVIPLALLVNFALKYIFTTPGLMDTGYAEHVIHSMNPFMSFAILLGALTGLQLWLSSIFGGWLENWVVYSRIPEAISGHYRLRKVLGPEKAERIANWILDESSGIGANISLGFLFGFFPLVGQLLGLDWNGHHVTISTASTFFAASSLHFQISWTEILYTSLGLLLIGLMNFIISFMLALFVASSARRLKFWRMLYYLRMSLSRKKLPKA